MAVKAAAALIAAALPVMLVVNGCRVLAHDWFVRFEYGREGFPPDRYGLTEPQRTWLALLGLRSIQPASEGIALLRRARLPDGTRAFNEREIRHMNDVRALLGKAFTVQLALISAIVAIAAAAFRSTRARKIITRGAFAGALATLGIAALAVPILVLGFDGFFVRFHELFFAADSWRFSQTDTLLRLYPEVFWRHTAQLIAAITVAQAGLLAALAWWWIRRAGVRP